MKNPNHFKLLPNFLWQVPNIVMYLFGQVPHFSELLLAAQILHIIFSVKRKEQKKGKGEREREKAPEPPILGLTLRAKPNRPCGPLPLPCRLPPPTVRPTGRLGATRPPRRPRRERIRATPRAPLPLTSPLAPLRLSLSPPDSSSLPLTLLLPHRGSRCRAPSIPRSLSTSRLAPMT